MQASTCVASAGAQGQHLQRGHRQHRHVQAQRDALRNADRQPHAGERARATTDRNRVELAARNAGVGQQLLGPWQRQFGMATRRQFEALQHAAIHVQRDGTGFGGGLEREDFHGRTAGRKEKAQSSPNGNASTPLSPNGSATPKNARTSPISRVRANGGSDCMKVRP